MEVPPPCSISTAVAVAFCGAVSLASQHEFVDSPPKVRLVPTNPKYPALVAGAGKPENTLGAVPLNALAPKLAVTAPVGFALT